MATGAAEVLLPVLPEPHDAGGADGKLQAAGEAGHARVHHQLGAARSLQKVIATSSGGCCVTVACDVLNRNEVWFGKRASDFTSSIFCIFYYIY